MTTEERLKNLDTKFDSLQHQIQELRERVEHLEKEKQNNGSRI